MRIYHFFLNIYYAIRIARMSAKLEYMMYKNDKLKREVQELKRQIGE